MRSRGRRNLGLSLVVLVAGLCVSMITEAYDRMHREPGAWPGTPGRAFTPRTST